MYNNVKKLYIWSIFRSFMKTKRDLTQEILKVLEEKALELTINQLAEQIHANRTQVHFTVNTLVSVGKVVPTRKAGNTQLYCLKGYEENFKLN